MASLPLYFDLQFFQNDGSVAASHLLYTYDNGTTTPKATYTDSGGGTPNANPLTLNSAGRCALWLLPSAYSFELRTSAGVLVKRYDDVEPSAGMASLAGVTSSTGGALIGFDKDTAYAGTPGEPSNIAQAVQEMLGATVFTRYVSPSGNDANDGSSGSPFATLQKAFDTLMAIGTVGGSRRISVAAGTYSSSAARQARIGPANASESVPNTNYQTGGVQTSNAIIIEGPDVGYNPASAPEPTPTAIFDGGGAAAIGIQIEGPIRVLVKNLKFINYDGSTSSAGINNDGGHLRCENVHGDGNNMDISSMRGRLEVKGGALENASLYSIRSIFGNKHEIGNQLAGAVGQGPFIRTANIGILAQENSSGHADYVTFDGCTDAIRATVCSRVNYSGSEFLNNTRAVRVDANSITYGDSADFNDGTADANAENIVQQTGGRDITDELYANTGSATDFAGPTNHTGTVASTAILTKTLLRSRFAPQLSSIRKPQAIKLTAFGSITGSAGAKQFKLRLGATVLATVTNAASDTDWRVDGLLIFTSENDQKASISYWAHNGTPKVNTDTGTEDMQAADSDLTFEVQLVDAADTVIVQQAFFEVWG